MEDGGLWEPSGLGATIFQDRYADSEEETWDEAGWRVANHIAAAEDGDKQKVFAKRFHDQIVSGKFSPGGRIWYGSGKSKAQLLNCFVLPVTDSREGWGKSTNDVIVVSSLMGGIGINLSPVRGRGSFIKGTGGYSTGAVSFGQLINGVGDVIVGGGGRRMALMLALDVTHPDLPEFLEVKLDLDQLNNANISVNIPIDFDVEEFVRMVRDGEEIEFIFNGVKTGKTINARILWDKIVENSWRSGEPGVLNGNLANKMNSISYLHELICTNPCVTGDTWVMTDSGPRRAIDMLDEPVNVLVDGKSYQSRTGFFKTGNKSVYNLSTYEGYSLNLTGDHRVLLSNGNWVEAQDLRDGDKIVLNNHDSSIYWPGAGSEHDGYVVGHFIGDGTWADKARLCSWGDDDGEASVREYIGGEWRIQKSGAYFMRDNDIVSSWLPHGVKEITDEMQTASSEFNVGLLRGLFDTDGHVEGSSTSGGISIRLSQSNYDLLVDVQRILLRFGVRSKINKAREQRGTYLPDGKGSTKKYFTKTQWRLVITSDCDLFINRVGFQNSNKLDKYYALRGAMSRGFYSKPFEATFEALEYIGEEDVYDITVDDVHAFDANGLYVHNCGEIWLERYGCCCLGNLVLPNFVKDGDIDWDALDESIRLGVRFLDDVLTVNHYPLPEIKENCENVRRIGLGVMGLHTMLMSLGMRYDGDDSFEFVDKLFSFIKNVAYDASVNLAIEKGPFPAYDKRFLDHGFSKTLKRGVRAKIREHGIRNCALLDVPPTGTTSMLYGCSSGIEPEPPAVYERRFFKPTKDGRRELQTEIVVEQSYYKYPDLMQSAIDVPVESHFKMQKIVQSHVDNAVSKTINLATDFPKEKFGDIWLEYLPYLKGTTVYRYGSRENEPIAPIPREDWDRLVKQRNSEAEQMTEEEFMSLDCPDGVCEIPQK